jgi:enterochelin esterase-like enzyme
MSIHNHREKHPQGTLTNLTISSVLLKDNALGDPHIRTVNVYLPHNYEEKGDALPVMYYLAAYTNSGLGVVGWKAFEENICERLDRLISEGKMGPTIVVIPDGFTSLGGNQYLDSSAIGMYASFIHKELIPLIDSEFNTKANAQNRAVLGKSSGGFAAIRFAMDFPGHWGAIANQSGDCGFDILYQRDFPTVANVLSQYNYDINHFLKRFWKAKKHHGTDILTLMMICMAATYDPQTEIELPFDLKTCRLKTDRWEQWLSHDPVQMVSEKVKELNQLNGLYMDCGFRDQFMIHYGMRQLHEELEKHQIEHTYEEFNGTHSGIDYRLDESLPFLYEKIK